jgi:hypothetical protein
MDRQIILVIFSVFFTFLPAGIGGIQKLYGQNPGWPNITNETKPWSRWWWMGSAVDEENLTDLIYKYGKAGFGGLEITPIYGVVGLESKYLEFLSPEWMKMLDVTFREARKNEMGIDMTTGTGWPFGGPHITTKTAASRLILEKYSLKGGERLEKKIIPSWRKQREAGSQLQAVTAYEANGQIKDLTMLVSHDGTLNWLADKGEWDIYAAFCGKTFQEVERAAPGGEGLVVDHFSKEAVNFHLSRFDSAFQQTNHGVRAFFNDSYELSKTNWTDSLLIEFQTRRGYSLQPYLRELFVNKFTTDIDRRFRCDIRETISDILHDNFTQTWTTWSNRKGSITRNQAHGSPANLLDLYAAVDIPESETFGSSYFPISGLRRDSAYIQHVDPDPVMTKFASSAANVSGKKLTSCETFTWLTEHFRGSLSQCKPEVEQVFLAGVNHVFYHGSTYSPAEVTWPGFLFYASTEFTPVNSFWPHINGLNEYVTRCQSILQSGVPLNDLLVYWPVYDSWMKQEDADFRFTMHNFNSWLYPGSFYKLVKDLMKNGYSLDFSSDKLLNELTVQNGLITTKSGGSYRTLVIPACDYMPVSTLRRILELAQQGANVIFQKLPTDVPGLKDFEANRKIMKELIAGFSFATLSENIKSAKTGAGEVMQAENIQAALDLKKINRETIVDTGLKYLRRKTEQGVYYYLVNHTSKTIDRFLPLNVYGSSCLLLDPQIGSTGVAQVQKEKKYVKVRVQIRSGEALFVLVSDSKLTTENWKYLDKPKSAIAIKGPWKLKFTDGGVALPTSTELRQLVSWTELPDPVAHNFSGSARYTATFKMPENLADEYLLDLGEVCESARVWINDQDAGIIWSIPFTTRIGKLLKPGINTIEIEVANLMANRIRQMDQQKIQWRNFHEINFVNYHYKPFDASAWDPMDSGLLGPVTITPYKFLKNTSHSEHMNVEHMEGKGEGTNSIEH